MSIEAGPGGIELPDWVEPPKPSEEERKAEQEEGYLGLLNGELSKKYYGPTVENLQSKPTDEYIRILNELDKDDPKVKIGIVSLFSSEFTGTYPHDSSRRPLLKHGGRMGHKGFYKNPLERGKWFDENIDDLLPEALELITQFSNDKSEEVRDAALQALVSISNGMNDMEDMSDTYNSLKGTASKIEELKPKVIKAVDEIVEQLEKNPDFAEEHHFRISQLRSIKGSEEESEAA